MNDYKILTCVTFCDFVLVRIRVIQWRMHITPRRSAASFLQQREVGGIISQKSPQWLTFLTTKVHTALGGIQVHYAWLSVSV